MWSAHTYITPSQWPYVWENTFGDAVGSDDGLDEDVRSGPFDGLVARGGSSSINGDTTKIQKVFLYGSDGDVDEGDIEEWVEANDTGDGTLRALHEISISTNGNTATVTGTMDTIEYP